MNYNCEIKIDFNKIYHKYKYKFDIFHFHKIES